MAQRSILVAIVLLLLLLVPGGAAAQPQPQTAPCVQAVMAAMTKRGAPYVWEAAGPNAFDCSGLTYWAYRQAGIDIGRTTYNQRFSGTAVNCNLSHIAGDATTCWSPGDLVFLAYPGGQHVAIYAGRGLFMDCYNPSTGCILHDVTQDSFYREHFWQARRIVSGCEHMTIDPGDPTSNPPINDQPAYESIPDLISYVSFTVPDFAFWWPVTSPPARPGFGDFIGSTLYPFLWLAWFIGELVRDLATFAQWMAQYAANFLALAINACITGLNGIWRMVVHFWIGVKSIFYASWAMGEDFRSWLYALSAWLQTGLLSSLAILAVVFDAVLLAISFVLELAWSVVGILGWIVGLALSLIVSIITALSSTDAPAILAHQSPVYGIVRGAVDAIFDSALGWLAWLAIACIYVWFFVWLQRRFSGDKETA